MVILSATVTDQVGCHSLKWLCFSIIVRPNHARLTEPKIVLELFPFKFFCTLNMNNINQMLFREVKYHSIITAINPLMVDRSKRVLVAFRSATATSNTEKQSFTYHIMAYQGTTSPRLRHCQAKRQWHQGSLINNKFTLPRFVPLQVARSHRMVGGKKTPFP